MSADRTIVHPPHLQDAKLAYCELVHAYGGQEAAAAVTGKSQPRISCYGVPNTADFAPMDVLAELTRRTVGIQGGDAVARYFAGLAGKITIDRPQLSVSFQDWNAHVSTLAKENGELMAGICADLADDGDVSPADARSRLADAADLVRVAVTIEAALKQRASEDQ